jgi:hypothetical protein
MSKNEYELLKALFGYPRFGESLLTATDVVVFSVIALAVGFGVGKLIMLLIGVFS